MASYGCLLGRIFYCYSLLSTYCFWFLTSCCLPVDEDLVVSVISALHNHGAELYGDILVSE